MEVVKTTYSRRSFIKTSVLSGGGMLIGFSWLASCRPGPYGSSQLPDEWFEINAYLKISNNGGITIQAPNPEFGQGVKTSIPMIVAEELDVNWEQVVVEQAPFDTNRFRRQFAGGSQAIRQGWDGLRMAGGTARYMLRQAAAQVWEVPVEEVTTVRGVLHHAASRRTLGYGEVASAAAVLPVPETVELKSTGDFHIVGTSKKNVDAKAIATGKAIYGYDFDRPGMRIATILTPPAFGMKLKSLDAESVTSMPGIQSAFSIKTYADDYARRMFDDTAFVELPVIVGASTWEVFNARQALRVEWEPTGEVRFQQRGWGGNTQEITLPGDFEDTSGHFERMRQMSEQPGRILRRDGDPEAAFAQAARVIERTYTAPHLAHNSMEPLNFFADVQGDQIFLAGPTQAPEFISQTLAERLGVPLSNIHIELLRMGGGFGRRAYCHYVVEAALISQKIGAPVKLVYTREDDMRFGIYRPAYHARYRAALDAQNNLIGFHVRGGGVPSGFVHANRFPAGAVENYLAEDWSLPSNISTGAFRAPGSNFNAFAEQAFLDEIAEAVEKDPIEFRLELLAKAKRQPIGERNDYDADRYAGVLQLVRETSGWKSGESERKRGVASYYCHNSYAAQVVDTLLENGRPRVQQVYSAIDCGVVVNPDAATNMVEGAIVDAVGVAMFGAMTFRQGAVEKDNFHNYRMIRHPEAPRAIDVHFVKSETAPTGLGEPPYPPVFPALANSLYQLTGKRQYQQPFQV